jgi:hypothetical protein
VTAGFQTVRKKFEDTKGAIRRFVHFYHIQPKTYPFHSNRKLYNIETIEWYPILTGVEK